MNVQPEVVRKRAADFYVKMYWTSLSVEKKQELVRDEKLVSHLTAALAIKEDNGENITGLFNEIKYYIDTERERTKNKK